MMKYCTKCGASNPDNSRFCGECGFSMERAEKQKAVSANHKKIRKWVVGGIFLAIFILAMIPLTRRKLASVKVGLPDAGILLGQKKETDDFLKKKQQKREEEEKKRQEMRQKIEKTAIASYRELAFQPDEYGNYFMCAIQDIDGDNIPEFFVNPSEAADMGCDYVMYTCKNGKLEKEGYIKGGTKLCYIEETKEIVCSCPDSLSVYAWKDDKLKETVYCSYQEAIFQEYKNKGTEMAMIYPDSDRMARVQEFNAIIENMGLDFQNQEIKWDTTHFCILEDFKNMIQQKLAYSGEFVVCESQISDVIFRYPKEWKGHFYFEENERGLSILSQDMMNCAERMNGEPGYWRHCSFLIAKVFYNFHDVDSCWQALQSPQERIYSDDMFFKLNAEKEDLHLLKDKDGNSLVVYVNDWADGPDKWAEFEGYDTECEKYAQNMREILLNWEVVLAGVDKKI